MRKTLLVAACALSTCLLPRGAEAQAPPPSLNDLLTQMIERWKAIAGDARLCERAGAEPPARDAA